MENKQPLFVLAGNGPYDNRGCEAIIRGTVKILRSFFDDPKFIAVSHYRTNEQFRNQKFGEFNKDIVHKSVMKLSNFKPTRFLQKITLSTFPQKLRSAILYKEMIPYLRDCSAVLSVGGDNYSLDYKKPTFFTDLDSLVLSKNKPIIIWGASVGPFSKIAKYEKYMKGHLKKITGIFVRESLTVEYLANIGITQNVYQVADPSFLLEPAVPDINKFNRDIVGGAIGINLSPLMSKYIFKGNLKKWAKQSIDIIQEILKKVKRPIYLIPHVVDPCTNDYEFLQKVLTGIKKHNEMIILIPPNLNAAETKWVISKMSVFAGARMHSVIAALSSGVPALSFAYSPKAQGINKDIYGNEEFCLNPSQMTPGIITERIEEALEKQKAIREKININLPIIRNLAMKAGQYLKEIIHI